MDTFDLAAFNAKRAKGQSEGILWKATSFEIKSAYDLNERDLRYADLSDADLRDANLSDANLRCANLSDANLRDANLSDANLRCANLRCANLSDANLRDADLRDANLRYADLSGADLRDANLRYADLSGANLRDAKGIYATFAPNLSSRTDSLYGGVIINGGNLELRFWAGCKECKTAEWLLAEVKRIHGDNIHGQQYVAAIAYIQTCFDIDMKFGKWDYLLENETNKEPK